MLETVKKILFYPLLTRRWGRNDLDPKQVRIDLVQQRIDEKEKNLDAMQDKIDGSLIKDRGDYITTEKEATDYEKDVEGLKEAKRKARKLRD